MPIISQTTWDKFTQDEKDKVRRDYQVAIETGNGKVVYELENLFGQENLQPQPLTYEDVAKELFKEGAWQFEDGYMNDEYGYFDENANEIYPLNMTSQKQAEKLLAINRLLNVAIFLNGKDWKPDWENMTPDDKVWCLGIEENEIRAYYIQKYDGARAEIVYFRTKQLAQQAVAILGEDTVRLALDSNY